MEMGNIMDWVKNTMGMNEEEENETFSHEEPRQNPVTPMKRRTFAEETAPANYTQRRSKVVNINTTTQLKVFVVQPLSYNDATEIAEHLKAKKPVVVNLEKLEKKVALKVFDFLSGAVFALDGSMKKVSNGILLVVPNTMGIMGDFSGELANQDLFDFM